MDLFSAAFRPSYVPKLNEISFRNLNSLNDWLIEGKNYYIPNNHPSNEIIICVNDLSDFLRPHAFEINRLSCASIESINDINSSDFSPKFLGWNITKYYYSAFFSAHCILKVLNKGVSNIENNTIDKIKRITTTCGYFYSSINSGLYCIDINSHTRSIRFFKNNRYGDNHEGLWRLFLDFLNEFKIKVYSVLPVFEAECVNEKIEELIEGLCFWGSNGGNWLSRIRNTINYSHKFGVWFPYEGYIKDYEQIVLM